MQKTRSPNYPAVALERAVALAKNLYQKIRFNSVPVAIAMQQIGYNLNGGAGRRALAALRAYGLVTIEGENEENQKLSLSDIAKPLVLDNAPEREAKEALKKAALRPKLFQKLWNEFGGADITPESLVWHLITGMGFTEEAAKAAIHHYKAAVDYASLQGNDAAPAADEQEDVPPPEEKGNEVDNKPPVRQNIAARQNMGQDEKGSIMEESTTVSAGPVRLLFPSTISQGDLQDITDWLDFVKKKMTRHTHGEQKTGSEENRPKA